MERRIIDGYHEANLAKLDHFCAFRSFEFGPFGKLDSFANQNRNNCNSFNGYRFVRSVLNDLYASQ